MNHLPGRALCLLLALLAATGAAGRPPATRLDSLRQLPRWSAATQARVLRDELTDWSAPADAARAAQLAEELARQPTRLSAAGYRELVRNLGAYYIHVQQPSQAIAWLLQERQLAWADSVRSAVASTWLSYCYTTLNQAQPALAFGREALRRLPPRAPGYRDNLGQALYMVANAAAQLHDYDLQARCLRRSLHLSRQAHDPLEMATDYAALAEVALNRNRPAQATQLLDSSRLVGGRVPVNIEMEQRGTAGRLALAQHRYGAAVRVLQPALAHALAQHRPIWETEVLELLVPALAGQGRYREALGHQQRLAELQATTFEENANRHAQELEVRYATARREQELSRQRHRIALLQAQAQLHAAQYGRRLAGLGAAALAGLLLLTLGLGAWAARQRRLRAQREERLRNRIAADLHDEVGTLLARVSMQADLLHQQQPEASPALARLLGNSRAAASTMRDIVWSIDAQADTAGALLDRIRDYLDQLAAPAPWQVQLHTEGLLDTDPLPPELRQQVYLIFKEAVTNALRHAREASALRVSLSRHAGRLELRVENDGQATALPSRSGLGLRSMRQRAVSLHARLEAGPRPGGGFRVHLTVPA